MWLNKAFVMKGGPGYLNSSCPISDILKKRFEVMSSLFIYLFNLLIPFFIYNVYESFAEKVVGELLHFESAIWKMPVFN